MIVEVKLSCQLRLFEHTIVNTDIDPYDGIVTITYIGDDTAYLSGFHGNISRKLYRELLQYLVDKNIQRVIAYRVEGKSLPFSKLIGNNLYEMDVSKLKKRTDLGGPRG